jgi:ABC-2 type transport system ATP-binding protein
VSRPAVELRELRKCYGPLVAVDGVSLTVPEGGVYGYLGPNGAGKTTSLRMMLGLVLPSSGEVRLFGRDPVLDPVAALEGVAGFVEEPAFYPYLSGRRNLELLAALDGGTPAGRVDEVLALVELAGRARDKVRGYSHGMRQRLGIAASLLRAPKLLLLDEPTTGLDPAGMRDMRELVRRLASEGITILLSSHILAEVEELCNRVAIIRRGSIIYEGRLDELLRSASGGFVLRSPELERAAMLLGAQPGIESLSALDGHLRFQADDAALADATVALGRAGIGITELSPQTTSLEELFLVMTGGETSDAEPAAA